MVTILLIAFLAVGAHTAPEVCYSTICGGWRAFGLTYDWHCAVSDENLLLTLPPGMVANAQECESFSKDSALSNWYNYRSTGSCELLSYCRNAYTEEGSITGPDPGEGQSCFNPEPTLTPPQEVILVIGGYAPPPGVGSLSTVDVITEDLKVISGAVPDVPVAGYQWTAGLIDGQVVVCGSIRNQTECQHFSLDSKTWKTSSHMGEGRFDASSVVSGGDFYMFGGFNSNRASLASVERYHSAFNSWSPVPEWTMQEANYVFCAVQYDAYIYLIGGAGSQAVMRRLSTANDTYETMAPMLGPRTRHACAVTSIGGETGILLTGGLYNGQHLSSTEFYSFESQKWHKLADMNTARRNHGLGILQGKPVVFGGYNINYLDSIEVYDDSEHRWQVVQDTALTNSMSMFAFAKVPQWTF